MDQIELQNECWKACYRTGDLDFVKECLEKGMDINARAQISGATPLDASIYGGHRSIFDYLILNGAEVNAIGYGDYTVLMAAANQGNPEILKILLDTYYRDIKVVGETPLHLAAAYGSKEMIQLLIKYGADPSIKDDRDESPLTWYSRHQRMTEHIKLDGDERDLLLYGKWKD